MKKRKQGVYEKYIKRPLDLTCALIGSVVLSPVMMLIALMVKIKLGGPVIFKQLRPGLNEKIFWLYKFRTMSDKKDTTGVLLPDEERLTSFGKWLRSTSLDELPELLNILKGDMAVVGPRPLLVNYLPLYTKEQRHRHDVRPGLTGLAQVKGRNILSWKERFLYDIAYVENITYVNDISIIFRTIGRVIKREGINSGTTATMEMFNGSEND